MNTQLLKRIKSFLWRLAGVVVVVVLDEIAKNLGMFNLSPQVVMVLGLVIGEITKYINNKIIERKELAKQGNQLA